MVVGSYYADPGGDEEDEGEDEGEDDVPVGPKAGHRSALCCRVTSGGCASLLLTPQLSVQRARASL